MDHEGRVTTEHPAAAPDGSPRPEGVVPTARRTLQVALNGAVAHPAMPRTPEEIAVDAAASVAAGATRRDRRCAPSVMRTTRPI